MLGVGASLTLKSCLEFSPPRKMMCFCNSNICSFSSPLQSPSLKRKSSIRTNDSVSVQRDSARGSAGLFLTAYLNSEGNPKSKMYANDGMFCMLIFSRFGGLHIQVVCSACLASATLIRITSCLRHILDLLLNKHFWGWRACNLADLLLSFA